LTVPGHAVLFWHVIKKGGAGVPNSKLANEPQPSKTRGNGQFGNSRHPIPDSQHSFKLGSRFRSFTICYHTNDIWLQNATFHQQQKTGQKR
jgi:hypothetical protein